MMDRIVDTVGILSIVQVIGIIMSILEEILKTEAGR